MNPDFVIEKIQIAPIDPSQKHLIVVKMDDSHYPDPTYFNHIGKNIIEAMERLGCKREDVSVIFGFEMQLSSISITKGDE